MNVRPVTPNAARTVPKVDRWGCFLWRVGMVFCAWGCLGGAAVCAGQVVKLEAQPLQHLPRWARPKLVLADGPLTFTAHLMARIPGPGLPGFKAGSLLRLKSVGAIRGNEAHDPETFRLPLPGPKDIVLALASSWWTPRQTFLLVGGLVLAILLALGWVASLRRQVRAQTEVIRLKLQEGKQIAESLAREKNLLATLFDHLPDVVFVKDKQGRFLLTNRALAEFHGVSEGHFLGKSAGDLVPPELARVYRETDEQILTGGLAEFVGEEPAKDKHGEPRWVATTKVPLKDGGGKVIGLIGICRDITEWKKASTELAYERDLLKTLLETVPDIICFKDLESRFVRVSKSKVESTYQTSLSRHRLSQGAEGGQELPPHLASLQQFAGFLLGKTDFDFAEPDFARAAYQEEQEIIRTGQPVVDKLEWMVCPEGKVLWRLSTKMPWRDKDGRIIGTFTVSKDITSIKEAEAKLQEIHKELVEASRQAGMAEVAGSVLHNVGNVLNSVNVSASLLLDQLKRSKLPNLARAAALVRQHATDLAQFLTSDSRGRQLPAYLEQLAEHLASEQAALLNELRSLGQNIEHLKEIVCMQQSYAKVLGVAETVQVTDLVEDALRMNAGALVRHDVRLFREYEPELPNITVERHKVLQVLVNVIRNAKYACDESGRADKRLTVKVTNNGAGKVRISVCDNGVGIPAENLTRIFNLGFTTRKNGHGFGLHSGALAAKEMGGALLAHSDGPGQGATFTLELPLQRS